MLLSFMTVGAPVRWSDELVLGQNSGKACALGIPQILSCASTFLLFATKYIAT